MQEAVYFCINKILLISVRTNDFYDDGWKKIFSWKKKKKEKKIILDRDRIRTCNLRIRSPTPYPLGHTVI